MLNDQGDKFKRMLKCSTYLVFEIYDILTSQVRKVLPYIFSRWIIFFLIINKNFMFYKFEKMFI